MALRLGKLLGNGPSFWLNLQHERSAHARAEMAKEIAAIETVAA